MNKFSSNTTYKTIQTILAEANPEKPNIAQINLKAIYQRDVVWDTNKQRNFINSCFLGIIPSPLLLNILPCDETDDQNNNPAKMCLDGKQRITSLIMYSRSKFWVEFDGTKYYYKKIPKKYTKDNMKILSNNQRQTFLNVNLPVIEYKNLEYKDELDIFNRIQNGVTLSKGEKMRGSIDKKDVAKTISDSCDGILKIFSKFKKINNRKAHHIFIINCMNMLDNDKLQISSVGDRKEFISTFETGDKFIEKFIPISDTLCKVFTEEVLNNNTIIQSNVRLNFIYSLIFCFHKYETSNIEDITKAVRISYKYCNKNYTNSNAQKHLQVIKKTIINKLKLKKLKEVKIETKENDKNNLSENIDQSGDEQLSNINSDKDDWDSDSDDSDDSDDSE